MLETLFILSPVTLTAIVLSVALSLAAFTDSRLFNDLLFEPFVIKARGQWHRFLTHAFIHANGPHLLVNMLVLFMFGHDLEPRLAQLTAAPPALPFAALYAGGILFSSLPAYGRHLRDPNYRAVGASGAVSAVLFAYILMTPTNRIALFLLPMELPAWAFGLLYLAYSWYMDKRADDNVAHDAHFYGALFGVAFMIVVEPALVPWFFNQVLP